MPRVWTITEIAKEVGTSRQLVWNRALAGHLPAPEYVTGQGVPLWSEEQAREIIDNWVPDLRSES